MYSDKSMSDILKECENSINECKVLGVDIINRYKKIYDLHLNGCEYYINDECDDCGLCECQVPYDIEDWI